VRQTQDTANYDRNPYSTSDLNPGLAWPSRSLEFNPMTKFFYTNYTVPKKRLTEAEMIEINGLYRIIGKCEAELLSLQPKETGRDGVDDPDGGWSLQPIPMRRYLIAGGAIVVVLVLYFALRRSR
jgi:hypothetical protein